MDELVEYLEGLLFPSVSRQLLGTQPATRQLVVEHARVHSRIPLSKFESGMARMGEEANYAIFFVGDADVAFASLKEQLQAVVMVNPWLAGRLVQDEQHENTQLVIDSSLISLDEMLFRDPPDLAISSSMPYAEIVAAVRDCNVGVGSVVNTPRCVTRVTLASTGESKFVVIVSMSHAVADGYTFTRIVSMLSTTGRIASINQTSDRSPAYRESPLEFGDRPPLFVGNSPLAIFPVRSKEEKQVHRPNVFAFYIDNARVEALKTAVQQRVSTFDILAATCANLVQAHLMIGAINLRGVLPGIEYDDAGNLIGTLVFDQGGKLQPEVIHQTIRGGPPFDGRTLQKPLDQGDCNCVFVTDLSSFGGEFVLNGCEQELTLLLTESVLYNMPTNFHKVTIFRPTPDEIAIQYITHLDRQSLVNSAAPLGGSVSVDIYG